MSTPLPSSLATILHLSDLHLGEDVADIGDAGSPLKPGRASAHRWMRGILSMQGPDPYILHTLRTEIQLAARAVGTTTFDFHVVTGDISTSADSSGRFAFAKRYLTGKVAGDLRVQIGLELGSSSLFCVPGNHDKMFERTPTRYLSSFGRIPQKPPYAIDSAASNGQRFTFYGIDSNIYNEPDIARGRISPGTFAFLRGAFAARVTQTSAIRILLLHHHPCDLNPFRPLTKRIVPFGSYTRLKEAERLLQLCAGNIDVIMHGHEHFPVVFRDTMSRCLVVSAGTTSEMQRKPGRNSFYGIAFDRRRSVTITEFLWNGAQFRVGKRWTSNV